MNANIHFDENFTLNHKLCIKMWSLSKQTWRNIDSNTFLGVTIEYFDGDYSLKYQEKMFLDTGEPHCMFGNSDPNSFSFNSTVE